MSDDWRDVVGWGGKYKVSRCGRVKSFHNGERELKPAYNTDGYASVELNDMKNLRKRKRVKVATLVAEAFIGPRPPGHVVCHNDGSRDNDCVENLRYATQRENIRDKESHGTLRTPNNRGSKHGNAKLTVNDIEWMFAAEDAGMLRKDIASRLQIALGQVSSILSGKRWVETLVGFPWYNPKPSPLFKGRVVQQ